MSEPGQEPRPVRSYPTFSYNRRMNGPVEPGRSVGAAMPVRAAAVLDGCAHWGLWGVAVFVLVVIPWFFGGMGPEGYWFTVWAGRACLVPLGLWVVSSILIREKPPAGFWVALVCWGLLALQVWLSLTNVSHVPLPPWLGSGMSPVSYRAWLPSTADFDATNTTFPVACAYGLMALSAFVVGLSKRAYRLLLWCLALNVGVLALVGIPFKYSGAYLMLGRWPMSESYFYSTFLFHNHWAPYALLGLGAALALMVEGGRWVRQTFLIGLCGIYLCSVVIAVSRLGTLVLGAFAGVMLVVGLWRAYRRPKVARSWIFPLCVVCLLGSCVLGGMLIVARKDSSVVGQRTWTYVLQNNPISSKFMLVEDSWPMVKLKPLYGWGLGSYGASFRDFQRAESIVLFNEGRDTRYVHCHNDWMEAWVELGSVGLLLLVLPWGAAFLVCVRTRRMGGAPGMMLIGLMVVLVFALGDMPFVNRSVAGSFVLLSAFSFAAILNPRSLKPQAPALKHGSEA